MMAVLVDDVLTVGCVDSDARADIVERISPRRFGSPFYERVRQRLPRVADGIPRPSLSTYLTVSHPIDRQVGPSDPCPASLDLPQSQARVRAVFGLLRR